MRRFILSASAALVVLALASPALGQDTYEPNLAVALKGGIWDTGVSGVDRSGAYGLEVSLDDALIRPATGKLRHMVSFNHADEDGLRLSTVEWNAHWMVQAGSDFWIGAGPGIGYAWASGHDVADGGALQLGVSTHTVMGHALLGLESRYQWVEDSRADNWLTMVKLGYRF